MTKKTGKFEEKLQKLEKIVDALESSETGIEEAAALFEEGVSISKELSREIEAAKLKIETLKKDAAGMGLFPDE